MSTTESLRSMKTSILRMKRKLNILHNLENNPSILKNAHSVVYQSNLQEKQNQSHVSAINTTDILKLELHHVVLVGPRFEQAFKNLCDNYTNFPLAISAVSNSSDVAAELQQRQIFPFDQSVACLCKGSRGIKMERCIEDISSYHQ